MRYKSGEKMLEIKECVQMIVNCLFVGLAVAVTDETIQIFFNRGSQVSDILLDFSSVASGIFAVMLLRWIINRAKSHKRS